MDLSDIKKRLACDYQGERNYAAMAFDIRVLVAEVERLGLEIEQHHAKSTCCCGDYMTEHNIGSGHAPVSMYDHALDAAEQRAAAAEGLLREARDYVRAVPWPPHPQYNASALDLWGRIDAHLSAHTPNEGEK